MRLELELWDRQIGELYGAILRPENLDAAVVAANEMMDSDFCHLFGMTPKGQETFRIVTDPGYIGATDDYAKYYGGIDPRRAFVDALPTGQTYRCSSQYDSRFVSRSEFYQDYLLPNDLRYVIGSCLFRSQAQSVYVAFNHRQGRKDFSDEEEKYFGMLGRHLARVIDGVIGAGPIARALAVGEHALNGLQYGVIGINRLSDITFINQFAERALLGDAASPIRTGRLREGGELGALFRRVITDGLAHSGRIYSQQLAAMLYITALPMPRNTEDHSAPLKLHAGLATEVILVCSIGKNKRMSAPSQLIQWFSLTPAEARLAYELGCGLSIDDYATKFHVSVPTARTQLRAILKKTGEERQQDLVRMLIALPAFALK